MLKEVGASGQISLGKKYAGQLFDMVVYSDGRVELVPMKAVPTVQSAQEQVAAYRVGDGWLTPERLAARKAAQECSTEKHAALLPVENKDVLDAYNRRIEREGSMGWRVYELRKKQALQNAPAAAPD